MSYHSLFSLHRDSVWTVCGRLCAHSYKHIHNTQSCHDIRREEYSLALQSRPLFDTAFWLFTTCGQGFRQGTLRTLLPLISVFHGPRIKIIGQLIIMHRRHRGAGFYSLRFSLLLTDLPLFENFMMGEMLQGASGARAWPRSLDIGWLSSLFNE